MPQNDIVFQTQDLTIAFQGRPALHHLTWTLKKGEMWSVVGTNGSGKSTLLRLLAGEIRSWEGRFDSPLAKLDKGRRIGYLAQTPLLNMDFPVSVGTVVSQGLWSEMSWGLWPSKNSEEKIKNCLAQVGLGGLENEIWAHLSGGQRQRALLARLLIQEAEVLLLDEPLNSLDQPGQQQFCDLLKKLNAAGKTIVCVLHSDDFVLQQFPKSLTLGPSVCPPAATTVVSAQVRS